MYMFISALPVATVIAVLLAGWRSLHAAALGVAVALLVIAAAFAQPASTWLAAGMRWAPVLLEVLLIVGGGLLLSEVLRESGAQKALADWLLARAGSGTGAVLLVVHGITPFAESVTGFGVGVTIGIPLLAHYGLPPRKVVLIGLLGLCAVPWGSMGPGTLVAATMAGLPFKELGQASALVSVIPLSSPAWRRRLWRVRRAAGAGLVAGSAVGSVADGGRGSDEYPGRHGASAGRSVLLVVGWHLLRLRLGVSQADADKPPLSAPGRRALAAYALLLGGVLAAAALLRVLDLPAVWHGLASPGLWLLVAAVFHAGPAGAPIAGKGLALLAAGGTGHGAVHCAGRADGGLGHGRATGAGAGPQRAAVCWQHPLWARWAAS
jgi:lactate permease